MKTGMDIELDPKRDSARIRAFFIDPDWARRGIPCGTCRDVNGRAVLRSAQLLATREV